MPETVDLNKLVLSDDASFVSEVATLSDGLSVLTWVLGPHRSMPELRYAREDAVYLVLEGTLHVRVDRKCHRVDRGQVLGIDTQVRHQSHNRDDGPVRVVIMRAPGLVLPENFGVPRIECPVCAATLPVEKGDRAGDRFVCMACDFGMLLEEHEGQLRPARFEPERCES